MPTTDLGGLARWIDGNGEDWVSMHSYQKDMLCIELPRMECLFTSWTRLYQRCGLEIGLSSIPARFSRFLLAAERRTKKAIFQLQNTIGRPLAVL